MNILSLTILVLPKPHSIGKNLNNLKIVNKNNINDVNEQFKRNLNDHNYMILYFNQDCYYSSGFVNTFRTDVDFIIIGNNKNKKYTKNEPFSVTKGYGIEIHFNKAIKSLYRFFDSYNDEKMKYLSFIDLSNFDNSQITNMNSMFYGCSSLKLIDLSNFDTSKVIDMEFMFYGCSSLESIDLSNFGTSKVIDMEWMFYGCSSFRIY